MLAERDGLVFVQLACLMCGSQATAIVTVTVEEDAPPRAIDPELTHGVIDVDDVLDMHRLLAEHTGDLRALLDRTDASGRPFPP